MSVVITVGELVDRPELGTSLVAGAGGLGRELTVPRIQKPGLALTGSSCRRVEIPYEGTHLSALYVPAEGVSGPAPILEFDPDPRAIYEASWTGASAVRWVTGQSSAEGPIGTGMHASTPRHRTGRID